MSEEWDWEEAFEKEARLLAIEMSLQVIISALADLADDPEARFEIMERTMLGLSDDRFPGDNSTQTLFRKVMRKRIRLLFGKR